MARLAAAGPPTALRHAGLGGELGYEARHLEGGRERGRGGGSDGGREGGRE